MRRSVLSDTTTLLTRPRGILVLSALAYLAAALHPILAGALGWPAMEILWSATLIPTIALSFYYGWRGTLVSLVTALLLFTGVEWVAHGSEGFTGERLVFFATVYLAIVTLGVAIGGLAELLRREHEGRLAAERFAATNELAVALQHEINNPLAALLMEAELLDREATDMPQAQRAGVSNIVGLAQRIKKLVDRVAVLERPRRVEYVKGKWMIDLSDD
jgi:signal transduction histidine kinase